MDSETPGSGRDASSHEKSENRAAPATLQMHTQNIAAACLPHTECKPQSLRKQSLCRDRAAAQSAPAAPERARPQARECCANRPWSSCALRESRQEIKSAPAWPAPKAEKKTRPRETSDAYCASGQERKQKSEEAS